MISKAVMAELSNMRGCSPPLKHCMRDVHRGVTRLWVLHILMVSTDSPVAFASSRLNNTANDCH